MAKNLLQLKRNQWAKVTDILGGFGLRRKLESLGVRVGSRILKVSDAPGPVVVNVGGTQLAIGKGMASKIIVEE
jgi:ferrous iron transport protein A